MAVVKHYWRNTQTNGGTGGIGYDLSTTQGTSATMTTGTVNSTTWTEMFWYQIDVNNQVVGTSFPTSISVQTLTQLPGYRWRVQRVNSSNTVQASSAYSQEETTTGTKTATLTLSTTWNFGDRLRVSLEVNRNSGHSASGITLNANNANTWVDIDIDYTITTTTTAAPTTTTTTAAPTTTTTTTTGGPLSGYLTGLMFAYSMESTGTLVDDTGTNNGTNTDVSSVTGRNGNGYQYNGTSSVSTANNTTSLSSPSTEVTLMADIYPTAAGQGSTTVIVGKAMDSSGTQTYAIGFNSSRQIRFRIGNTSYTVQDATTSGTLTLDQWTRVICVYSSGTLRRVNIGTSSQTFDNVTFTIVNNTDPLTIGSGWDAAAANRRFTGTLDNVMAWNRALTSTEIDDLASNLYTYSDFTAGGGTTTTTTSGPTTTTTAGPTTTTTTADPGSYTRTIVDEQILVQDNFGDWGNYNGTLTLSGSLSPINATSADSMEHSSSFMGVFRYKFPDWELTNETWYMFSTYVKLPVTDDVVAIQVFADGATIQSNYLLRLNNGTVTSNSVSENSNIPLDAFKSQYLGDDWYRVGIVFAKLTGVAIDQFGVGFNNTASPYQSLIWRPRVNRGDNWPAQNIDHIWNAGVTDQYNSGDNTYSIFLNFSGASNGDLMVAHVFVNNGNNWTTPSGWTLANSTNRMRTYTRVRQSGDGDSVEFRSAVGEFRKPTLGYVIRGANISNITYGTSGLSNNTATLTIPSVSSPGTKKTLAVAFVGSTGNTTASQRHSTNTWVRQTRQEHAGSSPGVTSYSIRTLYSGGVSGTVTVPNNEADMEGMTVLYEYDDGTSTTTTTASGVNPSRFFLMF